MAHVRLFVGRGRDVVMVNDLQTASPKCTTIPALAACHHDKLVVIQISDRLLRQNRGALPHHVELILDAPVTAQITNRAVHQAGLVLALPRPQPACDSFSDHSCVIRLTAPVALVHVGPDHMYIRYAVEPTSTTMLRCFLPQASLRILCNDSQNSRTADTGHLHSRVHLPCTTG